MTKIEGQYLFHLPIQQVYDALQDEALIREALPGQVQFKMTSPTRYEASMQLDLPKFQGYYTGTLDVIETQPPTLYRLSARGQGLGRHVMATGTVQLRAVTPEQTEVHYVGETDAFEGLNPLVRVAAPPLAVGFANRGLAHLERVIKSRQGPPSPPEA